MEKREGKMLAITIAAALVISLTCTTITPSNADSNPAPSLTSDQYKAAFEQYKHDKELFIAALHDRQGKIRDINMVFKNEVDKANADARSALATATTPLQKSTISAARRNAIDTAINARDTSIAALGPMPTPPVEPVRPEKQSSNSGKGEKSRR